MTMTPDEREQVREVARTLRSDAIDLRGVVAGLARETARSRRRLTLLFALALVGVAQLVAFHANACGVGTGAISSASRQITAQQVGAQPPRAWACDATFPLLAHTLDRWPSGSNLVGLGGYGLATLFGLGYLRRVERRPDPRLEEIADPEE